MELRPACADACRVACCAGGSMTCMATGGEGAGQHVVVSFLALMPAGGLRRR